MNLLLSLAHAKSLAANRIAAIDGTRQLTYREVGLRIDRLAGSLASKGVSAGDRVAIIAPNCIEYLESYYAVARLAAVLVPLNHRLSIGEIGSILHRSGTVSLLAHHSFATDVKNILATSDHFVESLFWIGSPNVVLDSLSVIHFDDAVSVHAPLPPPLPELSQDSLAQIYFTSGTTGQPKGVMLTHGNVTFHALAAIAELKLSDTDRWLHAAPMFHLADAWATFAITWVGGTHVFLSAFDAEESLEIIENQRVTLSNLIPTMLNSMVNSPSINSRNFSALRVILSGGAPIAPETVRRIIESFRCDYIQTYGLTETSPYLTVSSLKEHQLALTPERQLEIKSRTGRPFLGVEVKVVKKDGTEVLWNDAEVGEVLARGPTVTPGYWRDPQSTAAAFSDGWLHTGDLAVVDAEGSLNIVDRKKDTIITGGENVYSTEVEHVLYEHPHVLEVAVIGVPHEVWGEAVTAVIVTKSGASPSEQELIDFVKERLARYKAPKSIEFVDSLPKTGSGKIAKRMLREQFRRSRTPTF